MPNKVLSVSPKPANHGFRRTNEDKRRAVLTLLNDEEWKKWSDREIARQCAVTHPLVSGLRPSGNDYQIPRLAERNGTIYEIKTSNIGARQSAAVASMRLSVSGEIPSDEGRGCNRLQHKKKANFPSFPRL